MKIYTKKNDCCGCTSCFNACPVNAIEMKPDKEGFYYPFIYSEKCIECGICKKVCPWTKKQHITYNQKYYAARYKDKDVLYNSTSGGVFTALSNEILERNGIIYGALFDNKHRVIHSRGDNEEIRDMFRGSKYVQSRLSSIFKSVYYELKNGKYVLFTGTPCQNAGLLEFLHIKKCSLDKLYTCDFICHGVSSPMVWDKYIKFLENKFNDKLEYISLRNKIKGWNGRYIDVRFKRGDHAKECNEKYSYLNLYSSRFIIRESCFNCKYTKYDRVTDITIGDFWNIKSVYPLLDDNIGVSSVMLNTQKGIDLFQYAQEVLEVKECKKEDCWQIHLESPSSLPRNKNLFWKKFYKSSVYAYCRYCGVGLKDKMKNIIIKVIKKLGLYSVAGKVYTLIFSRK